MEQRYQWSVYRLPCALPPHQTALGNCEGIFPYFFRKTKAVVLSGRACRERMNGLISKYLEEDKRLLKGRLLEIFNPNTMLKSILVTTANKKPQTASSRLP